MENFLYLPGIEGSTIIDVPFDYQSNSIDDTPRISIETKWTDALRSRYYNFVSLTINTRIYTEPFPESFIFSNFSVCMYFLLFSPCI